MDAMNEQQAIGWELAFRGYLSSKWAQAQQLEHPKSTLSGIRQQWCKEVVNALWQAHFTM
jgi:hypothetical protein